MFARSSTTTVPIDRIDDGVRLLNDELLPTVMGMSGCLGLSLLVDRSTGRCIATTSWETRDAMAASNAELAPTRQRMVEAMGGDRIDIAEWEIAMLHRDHVSPAGACARVTWARPPAGQLDLAVGAFKANVLPLIEQQPGFCSASMLVDRTSGLMCGTVSFDSMASVAATRAFSEEQRVKMTRLTGLEFVDVMECELAIHHLRVPELV